MADITVRTPTTPSAPPTAQDALDAREPEATKDPSAEQRAALGKRAGNKQQAKASEASRQERAAGHAATADKADSNAKTAQTGVSALHQSDAVTHETRPQGALVAQSEIKNPLNEDPTQWSKAFAELAKALPSSPPQGVGARFTLESLRALSLPTMGALSPLSLKQAAAIQTLSEGGAAKLMKAPSAPLQARVETLKAYARLTETFFAKQAQSGQALALQLPEHIRAALPDVQSKVAAAFVSYMKVGARAQTDKSTSKDNWNADVGEHIPELPEPGVTPELTPAIANQVGIALFDDAPAMSAASAQSASGKSASGKSTGTPIIQSYAHPTLKPVMRDMSLMLDLDSLIIVVMMNATQIEEDMLRDQLKEMQVKSEQKKNLREIKTKMKQEMARLEGDMREEFNSLKGTGEIHASIKFEDYKAWRECQWADVRETPGATPDAAPTIEWPPAQLAPLPSIPSWMETGDVTPAGKSEKKSNGNIGEEYGLPPAIVKLLQKAFNQLNPKDKALYEGGFKDWFESLGFVAAESIDDIKYNLAQAKETLTEFKEDTIKRGAQVKALSAKSLQPGSPLYKKIENLIYARALGDAGNADAKEQAKQLEAVIAKELAKPRTEDFQAALDVTLMQLSNKVATGMKWMAQQMANFDNLGPGAVGVRQNQIEGQLEGGTDMDEVFSGATDDAWYATVAKVVTGYAVAGVGGAGYLLTGGGTWAGEELGADAANELTKLTEKVLGSPDSPLIGWQVDGASYSKSTGSHWGANGGSGTGHVFDKDPSCLDADEESDFAVQFNSAPPSFLADTVSAFEEKLGDLGMSVDRTQLGKAIKSVVNVGLEGTATPPFNTESPIVGSVDGKGNEIADIDDIDDDLAKLDKLIDDVDNNPKKSSVLKYAKSKHVGGFEETKQEKKQQAAVGEAAQANAKPGDGLGGFLEHSGSLAEMEASVQEIDDKLSSMSEASEIQMMKVQAGMDRRNKFIEALSNLIKKTGQVNEAIVSNLK